MPLAEVPGKTMTTIIRTALTAVLLALTAAGCSKARPASSDQSEPAVGNAGGTSGTSAAEATATATQLFATRCTPCHGPSGLGDGPASASLNPHPRNLRDKAWQAKVTDEHIQTIIKVGGAGVGLSPAMPGNPDLNDPAVVGALRALIRSFGQQ